jgi:HAMP domain-containing protein
VCSFRLRWYIADGEVAKVTTPKMTDEERQKLCEWLRDYGGDPLIWAAADEIERLAADVRALRQQIERYHGEWGKRRSENE